MHDQLTLDIDPPAAAVPNSREIIMEIMRRRGPCRAIAIVCERELPDDAYEVFNDLVKDGSLKVVGEVRYKGVVPAEHVDMVYAAA